MLTEVELNPSAFPYIMGELHKGGTLGLMLSEIPLERGRAAAYLPETIEPTADLPVIANLDRPYGGTTATEARSMLAEWIRKYVGAGHRNCVLVESLYVGADLQSGAPAAPHVLCNSEVYFALGRQDIDEIMFALSSANDYPFVAAATSAEGLEHDLVAGSSLTREDLLDMAMRTGHIIVGAYDGESYVIWSAESSR